MQAVRGAHGARLHPKRNRLHGRLRRARCDPFCTHTPHNVFLYPEFIERMEASYFDHARTNGCYVVSAAGFDSVPAEFGCLFAIRSAGMRRVHAIESFLTLTTGPSGAVGA